MAPLRALACLLTLTTVAAMCSAQTAPQTAAASPVKAAVEPLMTQIRKVVVFIKLTCNDGGQEFDVRGTGFFVSYPDQRPGKGRLFGYLVTNRHVALCWNESGHPMRVDSISVGLNRREPQNGTYTQYEVLNEHGNMPWVAPQDDSIDLAVLPMAPDPALFDYKMIPITLLVTDDMLSQGQITEGEPVFFAGFFYQFPGTKRIQPIVRQGIIAMMPDEKIPFVGTPEKLYLADVHAFGGNSGAPAFINLGGLHGGAMMLGEEYRLLGVVNGGMSEDENFDLQQTATLRGTAKANSGISTIVPAGELKALLEDPRLEQARNNLEHQTARK